MHIEKMFRVNDNGVIKVLGEVPEGAEVLQEYNILCAEEGMVLKRKRDGRITNNTLMMPGDLVDNYEEVPEEEVNDDTE